MSHLEISSTTPDVYNTRYIADGIGISCGDILSMTIFLNKNNIYIQIAGDCCMIAKASLNIMLGLVQQKNINEVVKICNHGNAAILSWENNTQDQWLEFQPLEILKPFMHSRFLCIQLPWILLQKAINEIISNQQKNTLHKMKNHDASSMDCDACIKISPILTGEKLEKQNDFKSIIKLSYGDIARIGKDIKKQIHMYPAKFAKITLNEKEKALLTKLSALWREEYTSFFRNSKVTEVIYENMKENGDTIPDSLKTLYLQKETHFFTAKKLWQQAKKILDQHDIKYSAIKGITLQKYYDHIGRSRFSSDIDLLTPSIDEFIKVSNLLRFELGYAFHDQLGIVGSMKVDYIQILSGHAHFIKHSNGEMVTIDLSFPNIPNGLFRTLDSGIKYDHGDSNIITKFINLSAHAFKHSRLPLKEINDCYILLTQKQEKIDVDELKKKLKNNHLLFKFILMITTVKRNFQKVMTPDDYPLNFRFGVISSIVARFLVFCGWPYSLLIHQVIRYLYKASDKVCNRKKFHEAGKKGLTQYIQKAYPDRMYWIPIIEFKSPVDIKKLFDVKEIFIRKECENCYYVEYGNCYLLCTDTVLIALTDTFAISKEQAKEWRDFCIEQVEKNQIADYTVRLFYDEVNAVWKYD